MVQNIKDIEMPFEYGEFIASIYKVVDENKYLELSYVIPNEYFQLYLQNKTNINTAIEQLSEELYEKFKEYNSIDIYPSMKRCIYGVDNCLNVSRTKKDIAKSIMHIYHSWSSDKSIGQRIAYSISDVDTHVALCVQPHRCQVDTLVTRCPRTGMLTATNNANNVHNSIELIDNRFQELFFRLESKFKAPIKLYFYYDGNAIKIRSIEKELMTIDAKLNALHDLYIKKIINREEFIDGIDDSMILRKNGYKPFSHCEEISTMEGLPSSMGSVYGKLFFNFSEMTENCENAIFCCTETSPEDLTRISHSVGAISARGGMTSHLSVIARGLGLPAVVGINYQIDRKNKRLIYNHKSYPEQSYIFLDGTKGKVYISLKPIYIQTEYIPSSHSYDILKSIYKTIEEIIIIDVFKQYSIDFQIKIATIHNALNSIKFTL